MILLNLLEVGLFRSKLCWDQHDSIRTVAVLRLKLRLSFSYAIQLQKERSMVVAMLMVALSGKVN